MKAENCLQGQCLMCHDLATYSWQTAKGQSRNRLSWDPTHPGLTGKVKLSQNWLGYGNGDPKAEAPSLQPHSLPYRGWSHSTQSTWQDQRSFYNTLYQPASFIRQEITFLCWVNSLSIQKKMCFLRKWKSLIYPEIFLGRNSVVFEYRWEIKNAGVFHSSFINEVGCIKAQ